MNCGYLLEICKIGDYHHYISKNYTLMMDCYNTIPVGTDFESNLIYTYKLYQLGKYNQYITKEYDEMHKYYNLALSQTNFSVYTKIHALIHYHLGIYYRDIENNENKQFIEWYSKPVLLTNGFDGVIYYLLYKQYNSVKYLEKAVNLEYPPALLEYGKYLYETKGDRNKMKEMVFKSIDLGNVEGYKYLAEYYQTIEKDTTLSAKFSEKITNIEEKPIINENDIIILHE